MGQRGEPDFVTTNSGKKLNKVRRQQKNCFRRAFNLQIVARLAKQGKSKTAVTRGSRVYTSKQEMEAASECGASTGLSPLNVMSLESFNRAPSGPRVDEFRLTWIAGRNSRSGCA